MKFNKKPINTLGLFPVIIRLLNSYALYVPTPNTKTFKYVQTLKASYILDHPEEYGIPVGVK